MKNIVRLLTALLVVFVMNTAEAAKKDFQGTLNLNTASAEELTQLPGIGKKKADAIVEYRQAHPFKSVSELTEVKGIGPKMMEKLQNHLTLDATQASVSASQTKTP